jgi:Cof subfamily protein (haloacid dehalogenase superfamily)
MDLPDNPRGMGIGRGNGKGKKLFVTDFDGTLLKDDKTISSEDIRTLELLRQNKIITAVATGRSAYSFKKALAAIGMLEGENTLPVDYVIFSTGAGVMDFPGARVIYKKSIPLCDIKTIVTYFDHRKFDYMVHRAVPETKYFLYKTHPGNNPDFQRRLSLYQEYATPMEKGFSGFEEATEVLAILPALAGPSGKSNMDSVEMVKKDLSEFSVIHATSPLDHQSAWVEVFHGEVSKSMTVCRLAQNLGISQENVLSIGNDYNDYDLLEWSGKGFVVENAPESMKQIFQTVSSNNKNGVSEAAKCFFAA